VSRRQLNTALPMLYAILVVGAVLFFDKAVVAVAVVGAMLLGLYYAVWGRGAGPGRDRNRGRDRARRRDGGPGG
jgi:hypothetical protein